MKQYLVLGLIGSLIAIGTPRTALAAESPQAAASTDGVNSEYMHEAAAQQFEITPSLIFGAVNLKTRQSNNFDASVGVGIVGVQAEYGISRYFSLGLNLNYSATSSHATCDDDTCRDTNSNGLVNPGAFAKLSIPVGPGALKAGLNFLATLTHHKVDSSGDGNADTGGNRGTAFIGYELPVGPGILGAKLDYDVYLDDEKNDSDSATTTTRPGASYHLSGFYEASFGMLTYGGALTIGRTNQSSFVSSSGNVDLSHDDNTSINADFYLPIHFNPNLTLVPHVAYGTQLYSSASTIKSYDIFAANILCRFAF